MNTVVGTGPSDFRKLREHGLRYVDKTRLIVDVLAEPQEVLLFARPRRFGKTLNLSTFRYFLEKSAEDRAPLFQDLEVWRDEAARAHFQRHPVLSISFKDVKFSSWEEAFAGMRAEVQRMYLAHRFLLDEGLLRADEAVRFSAILERDDDFSLYAGALRDLSEQLARHYGERAVILIDEYDTPIQAGFVHGYYDRVIELFRAFFSGGLKDNPSLYKGILTGILRVSKESLFSGLNNLTVYSLLSPRHAQAFGFTELEVQQLAEAVGRPDLMDGLRAVYNGYLFGGLEGEGTAIYNPWSVLSCLADARHTLRTWWLMTGADDLLRELLIRRGFGLSGEMEALLRGEPLEKEIDDNIVLRDLERNPEALWSFLLFSGYLKPVTARLRQLRIIAGLAIPNAEVHKAYETLFQDWMTAGLDSSAGVKQLTGALLQGDAERLEELLSALLLRNVSSFDPAGRQPEKLYHGLILGLLVHLEESFEVRSNPESGYGRADVLIRPRQPGRPGVVLELKVLKKGQAVRNALGEALDQIRERRYAAQLEAVGAVPIYELAVLFDGRRAWVVTQESFPTRFPARRSRRGTRRA